MPLLVLRLLGGFRACVTPGDLPLALGRKTKALLSFLALPPGHPHARDQLASLFWSEMADEPARHNLRQMLFALRKSVPDALPPLFVTAGETVAMNPDAVDVDVASFERLAVQPEPAAREAAAALYRGPLLDGVRLDEPALEDWVASERERLRGLAVRALEALVAYRTGAGEIELALRSATRLLAIDPAREESHRAVMRLHLERRGFAAALRQYQSCVEALRRDLGVTPDRETRELLGSILEARERVRQEAARAPDKLRILVVEDEPVTCALLEGFLASEGYEVRAVADGVDALLALNRERFDLVVSDIAMPMLDGLKLLEIVSRKGIDAPVVLVTGQGDEALEVRSLQLGATDYVTKPIRRESFLARVRRALGGADRTGAGRARP